MKYIIDEKLATAILNYLIKKPYIEVKHMADGLQTLEPYYDNNVKTADPKKYESHIPKEKKETCTTCQQEKKDQIVVQESKAK